MKKIILSIFLIVLALFNTTAFACQGPFPAPISIDEAYKTADAVFLGKVIEIKDGFPDDFKPSDLKEFNERKKELQRQNQNVVGRTIIFEPLKVWKSEAIKTPVIMVERYRQSSCEWNYDVKINDQWVVFATHYGNYLTFPAFGFDGRSIFTKYNPFERNLYNPSEIDMPDTKDTNKEKEKFQDILKRLEKLAH
jgi:hypothetical protein